jgi:transcriptional regulator with XRE-family HTH domain
MKIQELRKKQGLSQNDLIKISGVPRTSILKYETGENDINKASAITLYKISTVLGCKIEDLLENIETAKDQVLQNMYNTWRRTGEEQIENTSLSFTWDSGSPAAREDFSFFWGLDYELSFDEMYELEKNYA